MAFRFPGKSAAISLIRLAADSGRASPPFRCGTNPELPHLRGTGGPPVTPARPCTIRGLSIPPVTRRAVGSYPAFSPLPRHAKAKQGGIFSVTLSVDPDLHRDRPRFPGADCPMVSGLSSPPLTRRRRKGDCPSSTIIISHPWFLATRPKKAEIQLEYGSRSLKAAPPDPRLIFNCGMNFSAVRTSEDLGHGSLRFGFVERGEKKVHTQDGNQRPTGSQGQGPNPVAGGHQT